ncbi:MAG: hypothetical protein JWO47_143 [Candidatus Saccharibacteria bacterium]|nr:hypothetical protein [Candidatus Saccharibacteria bacterium]
MRKRDELARLRHLERDVEALNGIAATAQVPIVRDLRDISRFIQDMDAHKIMANAIRHSKLITPGDSRGRQYAGIGHEIGSFAFQATVDNGLGFVVAKGSRQTNGGQTSFSYELHMGPNPTPSQPYDYKFTVPYALIAHGVGPFGVASYSPDAKPVISNSPNIVPGLIVDVASDMGTAILHNFPELSQPGAPAR